MQHFLCLMRAIEFIEQNAREKIDVEAVAGSAYLSLSHLQKIFSRVFRCSVGDYIIKRRLCMAAHDLIHTDHSVTQVALEYQYGSTESFSRAFKKQYRCSPSVFRRTNRFTELYPKMFIDQNGMKEGSLMNKYDLTHISEKILHAKNTYIMNVDIDHLMPINEKLGRETGDIAIVETTKRIESSIDPDMDFFRIGGDQFIILTQSALLSRIQQIAEMILSFSDDQIPMKNGTFSFSLSIGITLIPSDLNDADTALKKSDEAMFAAKVKGGRTYTVL